MQYAGIYTNTGDIVIDFETCAWDKAVWVALLDKVVDDAEEMGAYMKQLLEYYLVGPQYSGYSGVQFLNTTRVYFSVTIEPTPAPTLSSDASISTSTPTRDPDATEYSIEISFTISNVKGIESTDFINNYELQTLIINSTKQIIYRSMRDSYKYDIDELCQEFWNCFQVAILGTRCLCVYVYRLQHFRSNL